MESGKSNIRSDESAPLLMFRRLAYKLLQFRPVRKLFVLRFSILGTVRVRREKSQLYNPVTLHAVDRIFIRKMPLQEYIQLNSLTKSL